MMSICRINWAISPVMFLFVKRDIGNETSEWHVAHRTMEVLCGRGRVVLRRNSECDAWHDIKPCSQRALWKNMTSRHGVNKPCSDVWQHKRRGLVLSTIFEDTPKSHGLIAKQTLTSNRWYKAGSHILKLSVMITLFWYYVLGVAKCRSVQYFTLLSSSVSVALYLSATISLGIKQVKKHLLHQDITHQ